MAPTLARRNVPAQSLGLPQRQRSEEEAYICEKEVSPVSGYKGESVPFGPQRVLGGVEEIVHLDDGGFQVAVQFTKSQSTDKPEQRSSYDCKKWTSRA